MKPQNKKQGVSPCFFVMANNVSPFIKYFIDCSSLSCPYLQQIECGNEGKSR